MKTKTCNKCNQSFKLDNFPKDRTHKDGRRSECKSCHQEYNRKRYHKLKNDPEYKKKTKVWQ